MALGFLSPSCLTDVRIRKDHKGPFTNKLPNKPCSGRRLRFQKEGHCIVKLETIIKRSASMSWQVVTPQLMGRGVRRLRSKTKFGHVGLDIEQGG